MSKARPAFPLVLAVLYSFQLLGQSMPFLNDLVSNSIGPPGWLGSTFSPRAQCPG